MGVLRSPTNLLLAFALGGCVREFRNDGFRSRLKCNTSEECHALVAEAQERVQHCRRLSIPCSQAREDYEDARLVASRQNATAPRYAQRASHEDDDEEEDDRPGRRETVADRQRRAASTSGVASPQSMFDRARERCINAYVEANGRGRHECAFTDVLQPDPPEELGARQDECNKACATVGKKRLAYFNTAAMCCDGSRSPTCSYGDLRSGCCSWHGGVCAEPEPK